MKKSAIFIHIPHSSLKLPRAFKKQVLVSKEELSIENWEMTDIHVEKFVNGTKANILRFPYSRLFCDVERFQDDNIEIMSKIGMGWCYQMTSHQKKLIQPDENYKQKVFTNYYLKHHQKLDDKTSKILNKYHYCYLIDLHSFSDKIVKRIFNLEDNPDICIGIDPHFTPQKLIDFTISFFESNNYTVRINYPYQGTIIPNRYFHNNKVSLYSIMIEINKKIYENNYLDFQKVKNMMNLYIKELEKRTME